MAAPLSLGRRNTRVEIKKNDKKDGEKRSHSRSDEGDDDQVWTDVGGLSENIQKKKQDERAPGDLTSPPPVVKTYSIQNITTKSRYPTLVASAKSGPADGSGALLDAGVWHDGGRAVVSRFLEEHVAQMVSDHQRDVIAFPGSQPGRTVVTTRAVCVQRRTEHVANQQSADHRR